MCSSAPAVVACTVSKALPAPLHRPFGDALFRDPPEEAQDVSLHARRCLHDQYLAGPEQARRQPRMHLPAAKKWAIRCTQSSSNQELAPKVQYYYCFYMR